jgi:hypothetical protein
MLETSWEIVDESGNIYGSGGPYSNNTQYNETAYVAIFPSCFDFKFGHPDKITKLLQQIYRHIYKT